ncbi:MAG: 50S ribosomal protein L5, partial [Planctomycetota bacterium]|nr:50S ribosomal protein L5 [Planctomycetota bacterium]
MARLIAEYRTKIVPALQKELGRENVHSLPKLQKIVVNMGVGAATQDHKRLEEANEHLTKLSGQKPQITRSRKAVSAFRLRENMEIGCRVTLRSKRMYEFFDRLITLALPRVRDFRGL